MVMRAHNLRSLCRASGCSTCILCQNRHSYLSASSPRATLRSTSSSPRLPGSPRWHQHYSKQVRKSPKEVYAEIQRRDLHGYFTLVHIDGLIAVPPEIAGSIISDFLTFQRSMEPVQSISHLLKKYSQVKLADVTNLAIVAYRSPSVKDRDGRIPPSQHKITAKLLLLACSKSHDPDAILHIMNAVNLASTVPSAREIANQFSSFEIRECRQELEKLSRKDHADAMTVLGQFYEQEGKIQAARKLYEEAIALKPRPYIPGEIHPMSLPRLPPWNALGISLLSTTDTASQEQIKRVFGIGAFEGDDPVSYYYLATLETRWNGKWVQYMSKAAAAGHLEAMNQLGHFYMDINTESRTGKKTTLLRDRLLARSLDWLTQFKNASPKSLGLEWFRVAAIGGHKPSMLELADISEMKGDHEEAVRYLQGMAEVPLNEKMEQWPELVAESRKRLAVIKRKFSI